MDLEIFKNWTQSQLDSFVQEIATKRGYSLEEIRTLLPKIVIDSQQTNIPKTKEELLELLENKIISEEDIDFILDPNEKCESIEIVNPGESKTQLIPVKSNKDLLIENFQILIDKVKSKNEKGAVFKIRLYNEFIKMLKLYPKDIETYEEVHQLLKSHGKKNPKKILAKSKEILETGKLQEAQDALKDPYIAAIRELTQIYAIGPSNAKTLYGKGVLNIQELRQRVKEDSSILNNKQKIGLKYHDDLQERIPRQEIEKYYIDLQEIASSMDNILELSINGSFRRQLTSSGDIDVLICSQYGDGKALTQFVKVLKKKGLVVEVLAKGKKKFMGVTILEHSSKIYRHMDIIETSSREYPFAKLYFTGSGNYNVWMRRVSLEKGYSLNEYNLTYKNSTQEVSPEDIQEVLGKPVIETEQDIFQFLDIPWKEPHERNI